MVVIDMLQEFADCLENHNWCFDSVEARDAAKYYNMGVWTNLVKSSASHAEILGFKSLCAHHTFDRVR